MAQSDYLFVAAIDFGTTYSGYAFSSRADFTRNPLDIHAPQAWHAGSAQLLSLKTPTCLLLDSDKNFVAFGYDAENRYADLVSRELHEGYFYFSRIKMILYQNKNLSKDLMIEDIGGKSLLALDVFSLSIKALKDHFIDTINDEVPGIQIDDVLWVLTVPAIWNDNAKLFMRKSAEQAGIPPNKLLLALEPEAASIYCQYLPTQKLGGANPDIVVAPVGSKYIVVDLGGGTADITVHEKINDGRLREIYFASGGKCGGTSVDCEFFTLMEKIINPATMNAFKREHLENYLDLGREFENKKRSFQPNDAGPINMKIPFLTLDLVCKKHLGQELESVIESSDLSSKVSLIMDKIRFEFSLFTSLFQSTIDCLLTLMVDILSEKGCDGVTEILLVGGFSQCKLVQKAVKDTFPKHKVIVPESSDLAVMKGAVIFGHQPNIIAQRISRYTYGFSKKKTFDPEIHDQNHLEMVNGKEKCTHLFDAFLKRKETIQPGKIVKTTAKSRPSEDGVFKIPQ
ncbi:heat shock 70 kDa protein 12A-like [Mytilus californianus]|uniref:heat shock 70 kDa protein 12A-like n=1 Tax=Mytilus californianus TaxID=6549 RepID=UPI002245E519|nr:heat shock 70 kDa protein 12A-like [Mytilus californianus]